MATPKEIDKEQADRLYELLCIKQDSKDPNSKALIKAINRAKATMTKEAIAWVEKYASDTGE